MYYRLAYDLEYEGSLVLALDPWMVFQKHSSPALALDRALSASGGNGLLLMPGKEPAAVQALTARLVQESPGKFSSDESGWQDCENNLFA